MTGQRRWVAKAIEETEDEVTSHVFFLDEFSSEAELEAGLTQLGRFINELSPQFAHHVYCILPWAITEQGLELENWIAGQKRFGDVNSRKTPDWELTFMGLCPFAGDKLPLTYRDGLEEFARSSRSDIIVVTPEENVDPDWLGSDELDFGTNLEVFEEQLWTNEVDQSSRRVIFKDHADLEVHIIPLHVDETRFLPLMQDLQSGAYGNLWNAELSWRGSDGLVHFLTSQDSRIYSWNSFHPDFRQLVPENCAVLEVCGQDLKAANLKRLQDPKSFN